MEAEVPSFFLSVSPFRVLGRTIVIKLIHLMNLSGLLRIHKLSRHHVLDLLMKAIAHHALVTNAQDPIVILETLVSVSNPIIIRRMLH